MNLLPVGSVLEHLVAAAGDPAIQLDANACVHRWNRDSACRLCAAGCPAQAIALGDGGDAAPLVVLDAAACVQCGYCLHACPTGVFSGRDETERLLQAVAAISPRQAIDVACRYAPAADAEAAEAAVDTIVEISGCLAALGAAAYTSLAALGVEYIGVRTAACAACPLGSLVAAIQQEAATAAALTSAQIVLKDSPAPAAVRKPVYATHAPRISRRSLWRRSGAADPHPISPLPPQDKLLPGGKYPPRERRTLLHALAHLPVDKQTSTAAFRAFTVAADCTACQVCANVCPTGALSFTAEENTFALHFAPLACTECGLCMELCAPGALRPGAGVAYAEAQPVVLLAGSHKQCRRCRATFAGPSDLCPACAFRRKHPTGSLPRPASSTYAGNRPA